MLLSRLSSMQKNALYKFTTQNSKKLSIHRKIISHWKRRSRKETFAFSEEEGNFVYKIISKHPFTISLETKFVVKFIRFTDTRAIDMALCCVAFSFNGNYFRE